MINTGRLLTIGAALLLMIAAANWAKAQSGQSITDLQDQLYFTSIRLIEKEYSAGNLNVVRDLLNQTRNLPQKGFEWGFWNARCSQQLRTIAPPPGVHSSPTVMSWSKEGTNLLIAEGKTGTIRSIRPDTGNEISKITVAEDFNSGIFSPDRKLLATVKDYKICLWDVSTGARLAQTSVHHGAVSLAFSPKGDWVASVGLDGWIYRFDASTLQQIGHSTERAVGSFYSASVSNDGRCIGTGDDGNISWIYDTATGGARFRLRSHQSRVIRTAFSPDGTQYASAARDGFLKVWSMEDGSEFCTIKAHESPIIFVSFLPDSKRLVTCATDGSIKLWDAHTGTLLKDLRGHYQPVEVAALSPGGKFVASAEGDGKVFIWDITPPTAQLVAVNPAELRSQNISASKLPFQLFPRGFRSVPLSDDGTVTARDEGGKLWFWNVPTGKTMGGVPLSQLHAGEPALSHDGKLAAFLTRDGWPEIYSTENGYVVRRLVGERSEVLAAEFSADSRYLACSTATGNVEIWDIQTGERTVKRDIKYRAYTIKWIGGGSRLALTSANHDVQIRDSRNGDLICTIPDIASDLRYSLYASEDGKRVLITGETPSLWNADTGVKITNIVGLPNGPRDASFSPDGKRVVIGVTGGEVHVYETTRGRDILTFQTGGEPRWITYVGFQKDGNALYVHNPAVPASILPAVFK